MTQLNETTNRAEMQCSDINKAKLHPPAPGVYYHLLRCAAYC